MAVEIMDGHTGKAHVTSDDWAEFNEATYGARGAVLGGGLSLEMETSGRGVLGAGAGIVAGRRFRVTEPEVLAFDPCAAGMRRVDVAVARYAQASDGTESVSVVVVKGEARASSPARPDVEDGDLPLWEVSFSGASVAGKARVTGAAPSIADAASDAASALAAQRASHAEPWVEADSDGYSIDIHADKVGGLVTVCGRSDGFKAIGGANDWTEVATMDAGWRPARDAYGAGSSFSGAGIVVRVRASDGVVLMASTGEETRYWTFTATYAVE